MKVLSIDIGVRNCAFYIEEFDVNLIKKCKTIEELYSQGKRRWWKVVDFKKDIPGGEDLFVPVIAFLDSNRDVWGMCNGIIIEQQLQINHTAQVLQFFIFSYFKNLYGPFKYISEISATRKTQRLNAPKKMKKPERKKWAITQAHKICDLRDDIEGLALLHHGKADDLADCMIQLKAFQMLVFVKGVMP